MAPHILILGATSSIAKATARAMAARHPGNQTRFTLAGRDIGRIERLARDLELRHNVCTEAVLYNAGDDPDTFVGRLKNTPDVVLLAFGNMFEQESVQRDRQMLRKTLKVNLVEAACVLDALAEYMERRGSGVIIGIASVAGLRGRASNYAYGTAKAGLIALLSGLRNRLTTSSVRVMTVLPGFVDTPMTEGLSLPTFLVSPPERVAEAIVRAWDKGRDVIYTPWFWQPIMWAIRMLPEAIFKKLKI